jgi:hypothetical protein
MKRESDNQENWSPCSPPLGSAAGYGDLSEGTVGDQTAPGKANIAKTAENDASGKPGSCATPGLTCILKEELLPDEKGTSLDEGGAG